MEVLAATACKGTGEGWRVRGIGVRGQGAVWKRLITVVLCYMAEQVLGRVRGKGRRVKEQGVVVSAQCAGCSGLGTGFRVWARGVVHLSKFRLVQVCHLQEMN